MNGGSGTSVKEGEGEGGIKFGWIQGVLIRNMLNIWGVMLFLRLSWLVGQAGIAEGIFLILSTTIVTGITALSMSAISTNGVIKGGGTYFMISRALGPEFGASIGLIFSLANAVACAMYTVGFCEALQDLMRSLDLRLVDGGPQDVRIIGAFTITCLMAIVLLGMEWEAKTQMGLLVILVLAIIDFFLGALMGPLDDEAKSKGFIGFQSQIIMDNLLPDYRPVKNQNHDFFSVFAIFFPAASGFLAGANISGDLQDPQSAIPKGTILSIAITTVSYISMAFVAGACVLRDASGSLEEYHNGTFTNCSDRHCEYGLQNNFQVVELVSLFGPIIYAGCFAATLSSALASLVSAPKVFQALCRDKLYPYVEFFGKGFGKSGEPVRGYVLTFIIATSLILVGDLNAIAPIISNFFLASYALINFSTFHVSLVKPLGWRPRFTYYNKWLSLLGAVLCCAVMFLICWKTALFTLAAVLTLYLIVAYRKPDVNWGSSTQAQMYTSALSALHHLNRTGDHVKNYRPQLLVLSGLPSSRPALLHFAHLITKNSSLLTCANVIKGPVSWRSQQDLYAKGNACLLNYKVKGIYSQVVGSLDEGGGALMAAAGLGKLKPNVLLLGFKSDWSYCPHRDLTEYFTLLHKALDLYLAVAILRVPEGLDFSEVAEEYEHCTSSSKLLTRESAGFSCDKMISDTDNNKKEIQLDSQLKNQPFKGANGNFLQNNVVDNITRFQKKQRKGSIDVWWLYDDGGLTLLLPYIILTRSNWSDCKLRVFTIANKMDELQFEQRNMASLLAKFRIDYSALKVIPDINKKPQEETNLFFNDLIKNLKIGSQDLENDELRGTGRISEAELEGARDKTNRHLRLRELLLQHSKPANLIVMTLPIPRKSAVSASLYLAWLEALSRGMPPMLLVRGNQQSVLTFYS